jgi:hypothetical protein
MRAAEKPILFAAILCWFLLSNPAQSQASGLSTHLGTGSLVTDKDTVYGVAKEFPSGSNWTPSQTLLIRNVSGREVVLDSAKLRPDSSLSGKRLSLIFMVKTPDNRVSNQTFIGFSFPNGPNFALRSAIRIPANDSLSLGQFAIGVDFAIAKTSAVSKRYSEGDSIMTPILIYSGRDSVQFQLKTIVMRFIGEAIASTRDASIRNAPKETGFSGSAAIHQAGVRVDGRDIGNGMGR